MDLEMDSLSAARSNVVGAWDVPGSNPAADATRAARSSHWERPARSADVE